MSAISRRSYTTALLAALLSVVISPTAFGQVSLPVSAVPDAVEEDWQLVIGEPDPIAVGPQITTVMCADATDSTAPFAAFDLNYLEYPVFFAGGMQVQIWSANAIINASSQVGGLFNTRGESVTWTQRMSISGSSITYDVNNGQSTTWGKFGEGGLLRVTFPTQLTSLLNYDPDDSAKRSGASWESNRVQRLTLVRVRYYEKGLLIATDTLPRTVVSNN